MHALKGFLLFLLFAGCSVSAEQTYPIQLERKVSPGQSASMHVSYQVKTVTTHKHAGKVRSTETETYDYAGDWEEEVLLVDINGKPSKIKVKIDSLHLKHRDKDYELLTPGAIVMAVKEDGDFEFTQDGKNVDESVSYAMTKALRITASRVDEDEAWGTYDKQFAIGSKLKLNADVMANMWKKEGYDVSPDKISGELTFAGKESFNGMECQHLNFDFRMDDFQGAPQRGWDMVSQSQRASLAGLLPMQLDQTIQKSVDVRRVRTLYQYHVNPDFSYEEVAEETREMFVKPRAVAATQPSEK